MRMCVYAGGRRENSLLLEGRRGMAPPGYETSGVGVGVDVRVGASGKRRGNGSLLEMQQARDARRKASVACRDEDMAPSWKKNNGVDVLSEA